MISNVTFQILDDRGFSCYNIRMNTPLKIYEQLASGLPLVATRIPSHTQVLTEDVCILVEPRNQEEDLMPCGVICHGLAIH